MDQIEIPWLLLTIICAALVIQTARLRLGGVRARHRARKRALHGLAGERVAETILEGLGHRILDRQPMGQVEVWVDGQPLIVEVRGDLLTRYRGRRYLVEVKTGTKAPRITHAPTRRQLLEYERAFEVHALLLVNADEGTVQEISFTPPAAQRASRRWRWALAAAVAATGIAVWLR